MKNYPWEPFAAAGNTISDAETGGSTRAFVYDSRGQLKTVTIGASLKGTYIYNYAAQLVSRTLTNTTPSGTVHYIHDLEGNVIAETDGLGNTVREYIWMPSGSGSDSEGKQAISASALPLAVVADVDTTPKLYYVHGDHLNRPIAMMDASKAFVWRAMFLPFGGVHSVTGTAATDSRFPGQWFNLESGLHYNWHRHYDPSTGRYLQPDPLGMPDGPSRYAYAVNSPQMVVDPDGRNILDFGVVSRFLKRQFSGPGYCAAPSGPFGGKNLGGLISNNDNADNKTEPKPGAPFLPGDPYSPEEVSKRQTENRRGEGSRKLDPNSPIPDRGPGENIKGSHEAKNKLGHDSGERNVNRHEEHSRVPKGPRN